MSDLIGGALLGAGSVKLAGNDGGGIQTVNGDAGPAVKVTLASIYAFGIGDDPIVDNTLLMPNGNLVFRSTPTGGGFTLSALGFFESPTLLADGRVATFVNRRTQKPAQQGTNFGPCNTVLNAGYVGNLIDGTQWGGALGLLTNDTTEAQQVGDLFWSDIYYGANFFFNQPISIPAAGGGASAAVVYRIDNLFASGRVNQARSLSGFGQEWTYPRGQRNGITPGFLAVWTGNDIPGPYLPGDGTGIFFQFGDPGHQDPGTVRGQVESHMIFGDPALQWGLGLWAFDPITGGPYQIAEFDQYVGCKLFRGGLQLPFQDSTTAPVSDNPTAAKLIWDDALQKVMISVDGNPYVNLSVFS